VKVDNGTIAYSVTGAKEDGTLTYNTLATPRAAQFKLKLPDGTLVWLNNASSIRYPANFSGSTRTVELTGEAYFDVAKDASRPFIVKAGSLSVDVLGTGFDVSAYSDEPAVLTTLVKGKIRVERNGQQAVLVPGQQVAAAGDGGWTVKPANTEAVTAWRDGLFNFDDADLHTALRQLARWYDVDVEFRGAVPAKRLQGQMQRSLTLNQVLEILKDKDVQFALQGRKLIVSP
jgi:ferric-dicitrate binding protein FerR (iron transport regulator)